MLSVTALSKTGFGARSEPAHTMAAGCCARQSRNRSLVWLALVQSKHGRIGVVKQFERRVSSGGC
jgi:hypothetical protein